MFPKPKESRSRTSRVSGGLETHRHRGFSTDQTLEEPGLSHSILRSLVVTFVLAGVLSATSARAQTFSTPWMHATNEDWATQWGILDPQILFLPGSWAQLQGATGNWDGVRNDLANAGISVFGSYV